MINYLMQPPKIYKKNYKVHMKHSLGTVSLVKFSTTTIDDESIKL